MGGFQEYYFSLMTSLGAHRTSNWEIRGGKFYLDNTVLAASRCHFCLSPTVKAYLVHKCLSTEHPRFYG